MWDRKNLLSIDQLSRDDIEFILNSAKILEPLSGRGKRLDICRGETLANIFFEASTRTEKSFEAAMYRLGGNVITYKEAGSSREKGETKEDTIKILEQYSDILVVRDPTTGSIKNYADLVDIPVINAGDGTNEHPTQALLDLYTINKENEKLDDLAIVFMADLKHGRATRSLIKALEKFNSNKIYCICPKGLEMPGIEVIEPDQLKEIKPDIFYVTRIQKERLAPEEKHVFSFRFDSNILNMLPSTTKVMHVMPRTDEMDRSIDNDNRVILFEQARHGLHTRMAALSIVLGHEDELKRLEASA